jgi:hypothetical protein
VGADVDQHAAGLQHLGGLAQDGGAGSAPPGGWMPGKSFSYQSAISS